MPSSANIRIQVLFFSLVLFSACGPTREESVSKTVLPTPTPVPETLKPQASSSDPVVAPDSEALSSIWEEMPRPPTPVPLPTPVPQTSAPEQSRRTFPNSEAKGRVLSTQGAVWRAGHVNGLPKDVDFPYPATEYADERNFAPSVHLRDPNELPAFLEVGQSLVIHLPPLPPDLYVLHVATTGGSEEEGKDPGFYSHESYRRRFLRLRFNDQIVWQRTTPPFHAITKVALDPSRLNSDGNLITLENLGTQPIPLDAVWVAPHRLGNRPMFIALDQGEWLKRDDSGWVRTMVVHVDGNHSSKQDEATSTDASMLPDESLMPVRSAGDLPAAWNQVTLRFRLLEELGHPRLELLRAWAPSLLKAVERGAFPVLHLDSSPDSETLEAAAYVFGRLVGVWVLPRDREFQPWVDILRKRIPDVQILSMRSGNSDPNLLGLYNRSYWQAFDLSVRDGRNRMRYFTESSSRRWFSSERNDALSVKFTWLEAFNPKWPGSRAGWAVNSVAEWLMRRETPVILRGGYPGGPFFPDGSGSAGDLWWWMKPLLRFGSPDHHPGIANIVSSGPDSNPAFLHWAVADNGIDSVQVVVHTPAAAASSKGTLELPVPWSGPTRMIHHATTRDWSSKPKEERDSFQLVVEAVELENPSESVARGWIKHEFQMRGMHVFELYPADHVDHRRIQGPEKVDFRHLRETQDLFNPGTQPPPSWWSRKEMGQQISYNWRPSGPISLQVDVNATLDAAPGWQPLKDFHPLQPKNFSGVAPLSDKSTRFQFKTTNLDAPQVMRMFFKDRIAPKADAVGLWIRAHRPPGFVREFDAFNAHPFARFYMGKLPHRQLIEIEYDRWHFISSPARLWADSSTDYPPALLFWPTIEEAFQPILEVNSFAAYRLSLEEGIDTPEKTLGFVRERAGGTLALLVVGLPGKSAFWSQRLDRYIASESMQHVEDEPRIISAESPDDPPPEEVRHHLTWQEDARLMEIHIPKLPLPPTEWYRKRILKDFPLIGHKLNNESLSAVLFNEVMEPVEEKK